MQTKTYPQWKEISEQNPIPSFIWILVKNSTGFMAAVNEICAPTKPNGDFVGYVLTPESEMMIISGITHWAEINQ